MTHRIALASLLLSAAICCSPLHAQSDAPSANPPRVSTPPLQILVTGCLKRNSDGAYYLRDSNGITWQLSSDTVDLREHVMHVVSVGGKPGSLGKAEANSENQPDTKSAPAENAARPLRVTMLKMVSNSCTR